MWRQWSRRRIFYTAVGMEFGGILIAASGAAVGSGFLITLGSAMAFFIAPVIWLLWLIRVLTKS